MKIDSVQSIKKLSASKWRLLEPADFPFWDYEFLEALESSESIGERTGWYPHYIIACEGDQLLAALPLFVKTNSYGEYIFDWQWADAFQQNGLSYYPKLTSAVPFTPATGPKLLFKDQIFNQEIASQLIEAAIELTTRQEFSSLHLLFLTEQDLKSCQSGKLMIRDSFQYHWMNQGYVDFGDFTNRLKGKRRRQICKERQQVEQAELVIKRLSGDQITAKHAAIFYEFYLSTLDKKHAIPYLTASFFSKVFSDMKENIVLVWAEDQSERAIAGALAFQKGSTLFGRYWGAVSEYKHLHFELCYYQLIEHAINKGLLKFEAGAQGSHKIQRGFLPSKTFSAHYIKHPAFADAIQKYVKQESLEIDEAIKELSNSSPFRLNNTDQ